MDNNAGIMRCVRLLLSVLQRVLKDDGSAYVPADFAIGGSVRIVGRAFTVVDADTPTRAYYDKVIGRPLGPRQEYPDTYTPPPTYSGHNWGKLTKVYADAGYEENGALGFYSRKPDTKAQFLEYLAVQLHFECEWDDHSTLYGDKRRLLMRVFCQDDTVEIYEMFPKNSGRDEGFPRILRRQKLPLTLPAVEGAERAAAAHSHRLARPSTASGPVTAAGSTTGTLLSTVETVGAALKRPTTAPAPPAARHLKPIDIRCGQRLPVFGKWLLVRRCDRFTRDWFAQRGIRQEFVEAPLPDATVEFVPQHSDAVKPPPPPHKGITAIGSDVSRLRTIRRCLHGL